MRSVENLTKKEVLINTYKRVIFRNYLNKALIKFKVNNAVNLKFGIPKTPFDHDYDFNSFDKIQCSRNVIYNNITKIKFLENKHNLTKSILLFI